MAPSAHRTGFWVRRPCGPGRTSGVWGHVRATFDFADVVLFPIYIYIYIIYTPNLGFVITVPGREREQGRFKGSTEGVRRRSKGALREYKGTRGSIKRARGSKREYYRAVPWRSRWEPEMASSLSA